MSDPRTTELSNVSTTVLGADEIILNMGPQHPSTHGVLRVKLKLDGERVVDSECIIGYLHRGVGKITRNRSADPRESSSHHPHRVAKNRQPLALAWNARSGYRRAHPGLLLFPRARRNPEDF